MSKGNYTATAASSVLVAADEARGQLVIQNGNGVTVALGINEAAVAGEGIQLKEIGDTVILREEAARAAINVIGNTGEGTYQSGNIVVVNGPYPGP